jgi:tellurite resistance protein
MLRSLVMTPSEKNIVKALVAVAWADGKIEQPESGIIEGLLCGFDASEDEEQEIIAYSKQKRTFKEDIPVAEMTKEDRELLLANAALLTHADGDQSGQERELLDRLVSLLEFSRSDADAILSSAKEGALTLGSRALSPAASPPPNPRQR